MKKIILVLIVGLLLSGCLPMFTGSENLKHFSNSIDFSNQATQIMNNWEDGVSKIDPSDIKKVIGFNKQALGESLEVDINDLNDNYKDFGTYYKLYFIEGTRLFIVGLEGNDNFKFIEGQKLLDQWEQWYSENIDEIRKK